MGEWAFLLFQITPEESEDAADLFAGHETDENGQRETAHFMPVKRA